MLLRLFGLLIGLLGLFRRLLGLLIGLLGLLGLFRKNKTNNLQ